MQAEAEHSSSIESQSPASTDVTRHRCYLCSRSYERYDHLSRHLKSHDNERSHRCEDCGKGFNRADLLNRHRAAHAKNSTGDVSRRRTPRACEACIKAKTKCDDERPCKRCKTRDMVCVESEGRGGETRHEGSTSNTGPLLETPVSLPRSTDATSRPEESVAVFTPHGFQPDSLGADTSLDDLSFPDFFEQIMMPDYGPPTQLAIPPDVSNFTQDVNLDALDLDFDFTFLAGGLTRPSTAHGFPNGHQQANHQASTPHSNAQLRSEAFQRSPWSWNSWIPPRNHHAFTGQEEINVREDGVSATHRHVSSSVHRAAHCELDGEARDRMIRTVTQVASSRLSIPSFPSLKLLEDLINVCLLQDCNSLDSCIHAPTFSSRTSRTELLLAMVASGSRYIALDPVWKTGLVIQEVARLAVAEVFEGDNSTTREIQPLQAFLLWLDVGVWSGFRRKTEIAQSFLQPVTTMLTWSQSFTKFRYQDFTPLVNDSDDVLRDKWKSWLEQETRKRLVLHTFVYESRVALANLQGQMLSPAQLMLPLPASLDLWLAPNAHSWRNAHLMKRPPDRQSLPSVMDLFGNLSLLNGMHEYVDKPLCMLIACHALAHDVSQFRQQAKLLANWSFEGRRDRWLSHFNRQREIMDDLHSTNAYCEMDKSVSSEILFTIEYLAMSLHTDMEDIQAFSGKLGEQEARKAFPRVRAWTENAEARNAVWHAGQCFRIARGFEKTKLRDFYAVALYQATLTLWVYGMVTSNTARTSGDRTPTQHRGGATERPSSQGSSLSQGSLIYLDDSNDKTAKPFKLLGQGVPGLRSISRTSTEPEPWIHASTDFCSLYDSKGLMLLAEETLRQNFPESRNGLPSLVENLVNLMSELGKLSGR
ncbi:Zinc finger [Lecanosticta acicola]|uniref:Zinc finger n=1 Tax=Lecanosticta acicola TaxID=111012 RepID=A0AAI8Z870_9PEZI|nr:Zinc finger [Lecanosticta acicola]